MAFMDREGGHKHTLIFLENLTGVTEQRRQDRKKANTQMHARRVKY